MLDRPPDDVRIISADINGRFAITSWRLGVKAFACRAHSISAAALTVSAATSGVQGQQVKFYFAELGIFDALITKLTDFGFAANIVANEQERFTLASRLKWLKARTTVKAVERRTSSRRPPRNPQSTLLRGDGTQVPAFIIDISTTGAAVSADCIIDIHQPVALGRVVGRVVRHLEVGFAVKFEAPQPVEQLELLLAPLPSPYHEL